MIQKLRAKFIALSMMSLFVLLAVIVIGMNVINYNTVVVEADETLAYLSENRGAFPKFEEMGSLEVKETFDKERPPEPWFGGPRELPPGMSPEKPYETRYFSVLFGKSNEVIQADTGKIKAVGTEQAIQYAEHVMECENEKGFLDIYRFVRTKEAEKTRVTFLDCGNSLKAFRSFFMISLIMACAGYGVFFFVILFCSRKMIRPVAESYEKQKRFITDAGHEIKTPLTIIKADTEVLEMEVGENEWVEDIQKQVERLTGLTNDLVYLARLEEVDRDMPMLPFPLSDVVSETAASFHGLAQMQGKEFHCEVTPMLSIMGNEKAIRQLVNVLLDNALKYSPEHGYVSIQLERQGRTIQLRVQNTTREPISKEQLGQLFERFYRLDGSRDTKTGGYGIGLSVAKAIVTAHGGKIQARYEEETGLSILVIWNN